MKIILPLSGWLVALFVLTTPMASAQHGWSMTTWFTQSIAVQRDRLALVTAAQPDPPLRAYLDAAYVYSEGDAPWRTFVRLEGWAFACGGGAFEAVDVLLNGFTKDGTEVQTFHHARPDVAANPGLAAWCPGGIPADSGIVGDIDVSSLYGGTYYIRLRVWDASGRSYETNAIAVTL